MSVSHEWQSEVNCSFVGLFLLLVLDWKTLVLMSGDLPSQMRWCQKASKEKNQLPFAVRGSWTSVPKLPIVQ